MKFCAIPRIVSPSADRPRFVQQPPCGGEAGVPSTQWVTGHVPSSGRPARIASVETSLLSRDDELLARLQAPPDLSDGLDSLVYWRGRRERLPWYRRRAQREAARMVVVWERRVRAAMLWQRGAPLASRFLATPLLASGPLRRSARRAGLAVAATTLLVLAIAPGLLVVSVLLKLF
jgi:hypothetical protein